MKYTILIILTIYFIFRSFTTVDQTIAVVQMDGLGWYRVSNFQLKNNCIYFIDGTGDKVEFCGAYKITLKKDFYKLEDYSADRRLRNYKLN